MKALKAEDLRTWAVQDLRARIAELEEERFRLQFRSATEPLEEPLRVRMIRKDIARLYTTLNQKLQTANREVQTGTGKVAQGGRATK
jgi:large subunit ribosomal protein L29